MANVNVAHQVPNYVQANYPAFVEFVQAYYDWLKNEYSPYSIENIINLDETPDEFLTYFKRQLARDIPEDIHFSKKLFYQRIKDLYSAKGTEAAYKLLFRLVYGQESEITYPSSQILRASDGRWRQDISIFVEATYGDPESIVETSIDIQSVNKVKAYVKRIVTIDAEKKIYEIFLDRQYFGSISIGDVIVTPVFRAKILPTVSSIKVISGGSGFRIGEVFSITSPSGTPTIVKVVEIGDGGSLKRVQPIKFGYGYISQFVSYSLAAKNAGLGVEQPFIESSSVGANVSEFYYDITERGYVNRHTYLQTQDVGGPAWDSTYVGDVVGEFLYDNNQSGIDLALFAELSVELGAIAKYPGWFTTNDGFLDDLIYIQDSYYYQDFSYVIRVNQQLDSYKDLLKRLLHTTGLALFGEFDITNTFVLDLTLQSSGQTNSLILNDRITLEELISQTQIGKKLVDQVIVEDISGTVVTINKQLPTETVLTTDSGSIARSSSNDYGKLDYSSTYFEVTTTSF